MNIHKLSENMQMANLDSTFKSIHSIRKSIAFMLSRLPLELINAIPEGQNNNIIWNAAHIISVQQLLVHRRSGALYTESKEITGSYKPGTAPTGDVSQEFVNLIQERLVASAIDMEVTYKDGAFNSYEPFETRTKIKLDNVEDAINFELFHEGLHFGYMLSYMNVLMKKS